MHDHVNKTLMERLAPSNGTFCAGKCCRAFTKLVAIRRPINVGRRGGKNKYKMVPYGTADQTRIKHDCVVDGMLMMRVPVQRDAEGRQLVYSRGEFRQNIAN